MTSGFTRRCLTVVMVTALAAIAPVLGAGQTPQADFERARLLEENGRTLSEAIALYRRVAEQAGADRALAAQALLRAADGYQKLGNPEARDVYERILRDYADVAPVAVQAKSRLGPAASTTAARGGARLASQNPIKERVWGHRYVAGRPSPDGRYLPLADYERTVTPAGIGIDLVLHDLQTGTDRGVTRSTSRSSFVEAATFFPDGKRLLYTWFEAPPVDQWQLKTIDVDGRNDRIVARNLVSYSGVVTPDGTRAVVAARSQGGIDRLAIVDLSSGVVTTLKSIQWAGVDLGNVSPDGRYLVYAEVINQGSEDRALRMIALDGSRETTVASEASNRHPFFTPDGRHVVFTSNRSGQWDLWAVRVADGQVVGSLQVADSNIGAVALLGFNQDGTLVYQQTVDRSEALEVEIDPATRLATGPPRALSATLVGNQVAPTWSPDGQRLAMATRQTVGGGMLDGPVSFLTSDGSQERRVDASETMTFLHAQTLRWFPDRRSLLLVEWRVSPSTRIFSRLDLSSGRKDVLFRTPFANMLGAALSPDGRELFYGSQDEGGNARSILRRELTSGVERRVATTTGNLQDVTLSPDGATVGFLLRHAGPSWCVWTVPAAGGEPSEIWHMPETERKVIFGSVMGGLVWAADGNGLFATVRDGAYDGPQSLWYVPIDGGEPHAIGVAMEQVTASSAHLDGQRLAFTATSSRTDVWTLKNLPLP